MPVKDVLFGWFGYRNRAAADLASGSLKPRYSSTPFSRRLLPWPVTRNSRLTSEVGKVFSPRPGS